MPYASQGVKGLDDVDDDDDDDALRCSGEALQRADPRQGALPDICQQDS
jgi:hypothetical protein